MADSGNKPQYGDTSYINDLISQARQDKLNAEKRLADLLRIQALLPMCRDGYDPTHRFNVYCRAQAGHRGGHDYRSDDHDPQLQQP